MACTAAASDAREHIRVLQDVWRDKGTLRRHLQDHSIDEPNEQGQTLLHVACAHAAFAGQSTFLVKQLLQAGADPNLATSRGFLPLMMAHSAAVANCLLDNGASSAWDPLVAGQLYIWPVQTSAWRL
jgi:Ankyrin repeat